LSPCGMTKRFKKKPETRCIKNPMANSFGVALVIGEPRQPREFSKVDILKVLEDRYAEWFDTSLRQNDEARPG
jgi:hypothetical protein